MLGIVKLSCRHYREEQCTDFPHQNERSFWSKAFFSEGPPIILVGDHFSVQRFPKVVDDHFSAQHFSKVCGAIILVCNVFQKFACLVVVADPHLQGMRFDSITQ